MIVYFKNRKYETYFHQLNINSGNIFKEFINALNKYVKCTLFAWQC